MDEKKVKRLQDTFDDNVGITTTFKADYVPEIQDEGDDEDLEKKLIKPKLDPVNKHKREIEESCIEKVLEKLDKICEDSPRIKKQVIEPTISTRLKLREVPFEYPHTRIEEKCVPYEEPRDPDGCEVVRMPSPIIRDSILNRVQLQSPDVSKAKIKPAIPSQMRNSRFLLPQPPYRRSYLDTRRIHSGIYLNEYKEVEESYVYDGPNPPRGKKKKKKESVAPSSPQDIIDDMLALENYYTGGEDEEGVERIMYESRSTHMSDNIILGKYGVILSNASSATSMQPKEGPPYEEMSWCDIPVVSKLVQTLREAHFNKPKKTFKKGSLENHSFTNINQKVLEDFCYKCTSGSMHQGDPTFLKISRDNQGICMPATAFCYAKLYDPLTWNARNIDEIVELGNNLYMESMAELHMHRDRKQLTVNELQNFVIINNKKVKFEILEPAVKGLIRSMDKRICNLTSGLRLFFLKFEACILRTEELSYLIWKPKKKHFYFFDATPRKNNLYQNPNGTAVFAYLQKLSAIASILLERTNLGNAAFNISEIRIQKIMGKDEEEKPEYNLEMNTYRVLNERQAVVQASFDLGDICFQFTRNKQALAMSLISIAYSRLSAPHNWHRKTLDKIMVVGNQLHQLCMSEDCCNEVTIENLPSVFTIGAFIIEVHLFPNRHADLMFKKGECALLEALQSFFERNSNAICQIGKSYLAIWSQRGMYFCFDPYTRNKEGLKCRTGNACVTMNKDIDTLVDTIVQNFENREAIFYLHALKIIKIQRDVELSKIFPRYLTLHEISVDVFKKHRMRKSKRKAIERPVSVDFKNRALKSLLATAHPAASTCDLASTLESLNTNLMPPYFEAKLFAKAPEPKKRDPDDDHVVDLDSPSLSDTQIPPKKPCPYEPADDIPIDDLDSYELTQEEKEIEETPEGEGEGEDGVRLDVGIGGMEDIESRTTNSRFGEAMSQVTSGELEPCYTVHQMNTDLTYCYKLLPARELKTKSPKDRILNIDEVDQDEQLAKLNNFNEIRPGVQILRGRVDCLTVAEGYNPHLVVPYMCIMASAFALEVPLHHWEKRTIDFVMKAGIVLFNNHCENFIRIDDFKFILMKSTLFCTVEVIFNTYIGDGLFETFSGQQDLEKFLEYHVFNKEDCGIVVVPHYACAVFYKRYLFYLFEPFNCDKEGNMQENDAHGKSCLMRFKSLDELIAHLVNNLSKRVSEMDENKYEFRLMTLAKPTFLTSEEKEMKELIKEKEGRDDEIFVRTQSEELKRPANFVTLPDGSQLTRGKSKVTDCGEEIEYIAPYICIMASAVGEKFAVRSWSGDVIDFIIEAGCELYKKSKYKFSQLAKLDIPKVTLGHTSYKIECRYLFDAPMKIPLMKAAIKRVVNSERDWAVLVTETYSCSVYQRNGLMYLFDPFPCNELGLEDGAEGAACVARFRSYQDLCIRIMFNKNKRESPEKVEYTRFILTVCRASLLPPEPKKKRKPEIGLPETDDEVLDAAPGGEGADDDDEEEEKMGLVGAEGDQLDMGDNPNKIGYQPKGKYEIIEGIRSLPRPEPNQATLNEDHFVCLVAAIVVTCRPLPKWDTKTINRVMDLGRHIFDNADELSISKKRTIRNILVGKFFLDIIVKMITIEDYKHNRNFNAGLNYVMNKRKFCIIQLQSGTFVYYLDNENELVHLFHPYPVKVKSKNSEEVETKCCWLKFKTERACRNFLKTSNSTHTYFFYTFNVVNIAKAPKNMVITHRIQEYIRLKQKGECYGKPFHERESWLNLHHQPWSRIADDGQICGKERDPSCRWFYWDIEYQNDLYSLAGTIHPTSKEFHSAHRGKQTLAITVAAIGMSGIYDLKEWNSNVIDNVVRSGDKYFQKCIQDIKDPNHEFKMEDLLEECEIRPYKFRIRHQSVVEGTMFLIHSRKYNVYKALRFFFDEFYYRAGVIISVMDGVKRMVSFSKRRENEYYMFDCQTFGPPMFANRKGNAYALLCTTLARLVHVLVLTLRGGDFFIYEVIADQYEPLPEEEEDDKKKETTGDAAETDA